jgi:hypothetical protein
VISTKKEKWFYVSAAALFIALAFVAPAFAAPGGAIDTQNAQMRARNETVAAAGAGGGGSDIKSIMSGKKPTTFTGMPAGSLPGESVGGERGGQEQNPVGRVVFSGDPIEPLIGPSMAGSKLDRVCTIAARTGYTLERRAYSESSLDAAYTFDLRLGGRKISTLYFDRSLTLSMVE